MDIWEHSIFVLKNGRLEKSEGGGVKELAIA